MKIEVIAILLLLLLAFVLFSARADLRNQLQGSLAALLHAAQQQSICPENSYYSNGQCLCNDGYWYLDNSCVTYNQFCQTKYGANSYGDKNNCYCNSGYQFNSPKTFCTAIVCPDNSSLADDRCLCNDGFVQRENGCLTYTQDCINAFGQHVSGAKGKNDNSLCSCDEGYQWNSSQTACVPAQRQL